MSARSGVAAAEAGPAPATAGAPPVALRASALACKASQNKGSEASCFGSARRAQPLVSGIAVGASTGGPQALAGLLTNLRERTLGAPIFVAIHMPAEFNTSLASLLERESQRKVRIPLTPEEPEPEVIYIPGGGAHLQVTKHRGRARVQSVEEPLDSPYKPSVNVLFHSAAEVYRDGVIAVVLTGMGHDGLDGAHCVREQGGVVFAQSEASCVVGSMPGATVTAGLASAVGTPADLARRIIIRVERARNA